MRRLEFRAMGCQMLAVVDADDAAAMDALKQTPVWFEDWEAHLSRFRPASELSQLNRAAGGDLPASDVMLQVIEHALSAARATADSSRRQCWMRLLRRAMTGRSKPSPRRISRLDRRVCPIGAPSSWTPRRAPSDCRAGCTSTWAARPRAGRRTKPCGDSPRSALRSWTQAATLRRVAQ